MLAVPDRSPCVTPYQLDVLAVGELLHLVALEDPVLDAGLGSRSGGSRRTAARAGLGPLGRPSGSSALAAAGQRAQRGQDQRARQRRAGADRGVGLAAHVHLAGSERSSRAAARRAAIRSASDRGTRPTRRGSAGSGPPGPGCSGPGIDGIRRRSRPVLRTQRRQVRDDVRARPAGRWPPAARASRAQGQPGEPHRRGRRSPEEWRPARLAHARVLVQQHGRRRRPPRRCRSRGRRSPSRGRASGPAPGAGPAAAGRPPGCGPCR